MIQAMNFAYEASKVPHRVFFEGLSNLVLDAMLLFEKQQMISLFPLGDEILFDRAKPSPLQAFGLIPAPKCILIPN